MFSTSWPGGRLLGAIGALMIAALVVVPAAVRARQRLPHHDLAQHDPIPSRLRLNWNGEAAAAKVKPAPPDQRQLISPLTVHADLPAVPIRPARVRVSDERVPILPLDRPPLLFRGPPVSLLI